MEASAPFDPDRCDGAKRTGKRARLACSFCSARKKRCSGHRPCSECALRAITCDYPVQSRRRGPVRGAKWQAKRLAAENRLTTFVDGINNETVYDLLQVYLTYVHPHWPIVVECQSMQSIAHLGASEPLLLRAMLAVAAATRTRSEADRRFDEARTISKEFHVEMQAHPILPSSLASVQTLVLFTLINIGAGLHVEAYQRCCQACTMSLELGLHQLNTSSAAAIRNEPKIFWSVYTLDKLLAIMLDKPVLLRQRDITTPLSMQDDVHHTYQKRISDDITFAFFVRLMLILELIIDGVYTPRAQEERRMSRGGPLGSTYEHTVTAIERQLDLWYQSLPVPMQWYDCAPNERGTILPQSITISAWYFACTLLLYRPAFSSAQHKRELAQRGSDKVRTSAFAICHCLSEYQDRFTVRCIPSAWVFLVFLSAVIHASCSPGPSDRHLQAFDQCIVVLREMAKTWRNADRQVQMLYAVFPSLTRRTKAAQKQSRTDSGSAAAPSPLSEPATAQSEASDLVLWDQVLAFLRLPD